MKPAEIERFSGATATNLMISEDQPPYPAATRPSAVPLLCLSDFLEKRIRDQPADWSLAYSLRTNSRASACASPDSSLIQESVRENSTQHRRVVLCQARFPDDMPVENKC